MRVRLAEAIIGVLICVPEGNQRESKQKVEAYADQACWRARKESALKLRFNVWRSEVVAEGRKVKFPIVCAVDDVVNGGANEKEMKEEKNQQLSRNNYEISSNRRKARAEEALCENLRTAINQILLRQANGQQIFGEHFPHNNSHQQRSLFLYFEKEK